MNLENAYKTHKLIALIFPFSNNAVLTPTNKYFHKSLLVFPQIILYVDYISKARLALKFS